MHIYFLIELLSQAGMILVSGVWDVICAFRKSAIPFCKNKYIMEAKIIIRRIFFTEKGPTITVTSFCSDNRMYA